jgi:hypothetical protein
VWRALRQLLTVVEWRCRYCQSPNATSMTVWNSIKYSLICADCNCVQNYPDYVLSFDPTPAKGRGRRRDEVA